jgi:hypothetical protein
MGIVMYSTFKYFTSSSYTERYYISLLSVPQAMSIATSSEDWCLPSCQAVQFGRWLPMFRNNLLPPVRGKGGGGIGLDNKDKIRRRKESAGKNRARKENTDKNRKRKNSMDNNRRRKESTCKFVGGFRAGVRIAGERRVRVRIARGRKARIRIVRRRTTLIRIAGE